MVGTGWLDASSRKFLGADDPSVPGMAGAGWLDASDRKFRDADDPLAPGMAGAGWLDASDRKFLGTDCPACLDFERREGPKKVKRAGCAETPR